MSRIKKSNEKGQEMVEFALVLPIFLLVCFGIIDFSWIMNQYISFNQAARSAEWNVKIEDTKGSDSADSLSVANDVAEPIINKEMADDSPTLQTSDLTVSNSSISISSQKQYYCNPDDNGSVNNFTRNYRMIRVQADLSYKVPLLTPVAKMLFQQGITLSKHIDKERILSFNDAPDTTS